MLRVFRQRSTRARAKFAAFCALPCLAICALLLHYRHYSLKSLLSTPRVVPITSLSASCGPSVSEMPNANIIERLQAGPVATLGLSMFYRGKKKLPPQRSSFDTLMKERWVQMEKDHILRFGVGVRPTERLAGKHGLVKALVVGRATAKRHNKALDEGPKHVVQAFNPEGFNFRKVGSPELLCALAHEGTLEAKQALSCSDADAQEADLVLVNVSPIDYANVLLVPHTGRGMPQVLTMDTIQRAILFQLASTAPNFRVGFNGLGGFASVNHLHFQGYYFAQGAPSEASHLSQGGLPVERSATSLLASTIESTVSELQGYPVRGLVFETRRPLEEKAWRDIFTAAVMRCVQACIKANIAHNLLLSPTASGSGRDTPGTDQEGFRLFLLPQRSFKREDPAEIGPAFPELSGHILVKREAEYATMKEEQAVAILRRVSISADEMDELKKCA